MNERIKDLAEQTNENLSNVIRDDEWLEKFAKSLIEENARLIDMWLDSGRYKTFGQRLKAHFESNE